MARLCLPEKKRDAFRKALKNGDVVISELYEMSSKERNALLKKYVGDSSGLVNAKFEQAMLSTQKKALRNWVEQSITAKEPVRKDLLKRVNRIQKYLDQDEEFGFLEDIASDKLGVRVTEQEAKTISNLSKKVDEYKAKIPENYTEVTEEGLQYGFALDRFKTYSADLIREAEKMGVKERLVTPTGWGRNLVDLGRITKSTVASIDNSFMGRQGIKVLFTNPKLWFKTFAQSLKTFGQELMTKGPGLFKSRDDAIMSAIRAEVYARPNNLNGKYRASKNGYGLGILHEEAFPTSVPERIPFLGRLFKASESAFSASAIRMRAQLADQVIERAEKMGIDMLDEKNATAWGNLVTSMTGRGELGRLAPIGETLNATFFSPRFLKSNFNTLTAHLADPLATPEVKREAVKNLAKIGTSVFSLLAINEMLKPGSVEWDPRQTNFGKVKVGDNYYDITGGMGGLVRFGSRFFTGKSYSSNTKTWSDLTNAGFGENTRFDLAVDFFSGKTSPLGSAFRDWARGRNFDGEKPTWFNTTIGLITPISAEMMIEELQKGDDDIITLMLAEGLGFSPNSASYRPYGKKWDELKTKSTPDYNKAIKEVSKQFNEKAKILESSKQWEEMTQEERKKEMNKIRDEITSRVLRQYGIR